LVGIETLNRRFVLEEHQIVPLDKVADFSSLRQGASSGQLIRSSFAVSLIELVLQAAEARGQDIASSMMKERRAHAIPDAHINLALEESSHKSRYGHRGSGTTEYRLRLAEVISRTRGYRRC
jgi:hypothetical protein